ncbi:hypothetical protein BKA63DRAFT_489047 [Paraphoma chrysanthemicola]|nr:hypothetical protein BKA63DRAFT_489047 [Paraphoma chrysanthemicola]
MTKPKRANVSDTLPSKASSWFDLYPSNPLQDPQTPPPPSPDPKTAITIRENYLNHLSMEGKFCSSCKTSASLAGSCGPTCTLLRPSNRSAVTENVSAEWLKNATESIQMYERFIREVTDATQREIGSQIQVEQWEHDVESLRSGTLNESENREEKGWPAGKAGRENVRG